MKNKMYQGLKILHLISSSGFLGAENVVLELSKETTKAGFWVTIGIMENRNNLHMELADRARSEGLQVQIFPCRGRFDRRTIASVRDFIDSEQPNIMHSHGYKSNFYAWRAIAGSNIPWIVTNHLWKRTTFALKGYACLDSLLIRRADRVVAVSDEIASEMMNRGISSQKIIIIDNGVNLERFRVIRNDDLRNSFGFNGTSKVIGTIASLTSEKGHIYLLEAARQVIDKCPECRFLIVGDGGQRQFLAEKTSHLGLAEKVLFAGSRKDVPEILLMLDVFVLPSLKEGLPMALLEAMASKVPVIATKVGAIPNVIENEMSGILISPEKPDAIAEAINTILSDGNSAKEMARRGFEKVRDHFSLKKMAEKYLSVYKELLS
jgi:glycosyltransferase involved in cell wall biosynthesis